MRRIALALIGVAGMAAAQEPPPPVQPARYDAVGLAGRTPDAAAQDRATVAHRSLSPGSIVEVTALDSGRTILAEVAAADTLPPDRIADLSPAAVAALRLADTPLAPVRIRPAAPTPPEQHALRGGGIVTRLDAPPALLVGLRRQLPAGRRPSLQMATQAVAPPPGARPFRPAAPPVGRARPAATAPAAPVTGGWMVQVAALSDAKRAATLAKSVGGVVRAAGTLYRVQAGPFATRAAADRARADIARRGFGDARTIAQD